jgi:ribosomal protein S14
MTRAQAIAELAELAAGRSDLLARFAGTTVGLHEGDLDEERYRRAAQLCIDAGADTAMIPHWIEVGRQRAREIAEKHAATRTVR